MSGSARARGGPAPPAVTHFTVAKSKVSKSGSTTQLAMRKKNVITIDSDDEDLSDYGHYARYSANGLPTPQHTSSAVPDRAVPETPTKKGGRAPGRIAALVRSLDTTLRTPPPLVPSSGLDGPHSSKKTNGLVHRRDGSSIKDADTSGRSLLHTPSTFTSFSSPCDAQSSKSQSSRRSDGIETSRQKPNSTLSPAAITSSQLTLPRLSSALHPAFPPAVKPRIYSASQPGGKRNIDIGSKKLEAFGFVSASSLLPRTTTKDATTIPPAITNTQNSPAAAAVTTLPEVELELVSKPKLKPIKRDEAQILVGSREPLLQATQDTAGVATPTSISKTISKPIKQEPSQVRFSAARLLPQTPEKPIRARRAHTPSYSSGTYRDPYAISSDSEDDLSNRNGNPHSCPPLKSFAEIADTYETASDVEAVLNQFPAWLDSPSPTELRSSYLGASRPATSSRPGKRFWGDGIGNRGRAGGDSRRVRFCEGDGFSTSPVPAKRTTVAPSRRCLTSFEERATSTSASRNASPIRATTSAGRLTSSADRTSPPTRRVAPLGRVDPLMRRVTPLTQQDTFPLQQQLAPTQQTTTSLDSCGRSYPPLAKSNTPRVEITVSDSEPEPRDHYSNEEDMDLNANSNLNPDDHGHCSSSRDKNSIHQQKGSSSSSSSSSSVVPREKKKKDLGKKKRRKRKERNDDKGGGGQHHDVAASSSRRHRNRDRETWKDGKRLKRDERNVTRGRE
ncbi:hypothetical protein F4680DRAFT_427423 [Xylaria scruposa]|nr:hypothetical protein F4680DRAFT_427423 [Xylaria scruposa]